MSHYQYIAVYEGLRSRIEAGEFNVGGQLPSISAIQEQYDVPSLGTVRAAQQLLVEDGMIRTEQGRGAFVVSTESARTIDATEALDAALAQIKRAQSALAAQKVRRVTFDLDANDDTYYVLTEALREWESSEEFHASDDDDALAADRRRHAAHARELLDMVESALDCTNHN